MASACSIQRLTPREPRRRVILRARLRTAAGWSDAHILNISSGGLMIHAGRPASPGSTIELWHGERLIVGRVVWREGLRAGLASEHPLRVDDIVALAQTPASELAALWPGRERRKRPRTHDGDRLRSRAIQFAGIAAISASLAFAAFPLVDQALARPLASIGAALER